MCLTKLTHKLLGLIPIDLLEDALLGTAIVHLFVVTKSAAAHTLLRSLSFGCAHLEVNHGRHQKAKALRNRLQIECVHIEDLFQLMRIIGAHI